MQVDIIKFNSRLQVIKLKQKQKKIIYQSMMRMENCQVKKKNKVGKIKLAKNEVND